MGLKVRPLLVPLENPQLYHIMQTPSPHTSAYGVPFMRKYLSQLFSYIELWLSHHNHACHGSTTKKYDTYYRLLG